MENPKNPNPRKSDKIATYIARFIACCIGASLLVIFVTVKIWKNSGIEGLIIYAAMTGLCLGYGLGSDVLGAKLFDLFTHMNASKAVEADKKNNRIGQFYTKIVLPVAIIFIVFFGAVLIIAFLNRPKQ